MRITLSNIEIKNHSNHDLWLALPRRLTLNLTLKVKLHTLENECAARFLDEESFATWAALGTTDTGGAGAVEGARATKSPKAAEYVVLLRTT